MTGEASLRYGSSLSPLLSSPLLTDNMLIFRPCVIHRIEL